MFLRHLSGEAKTSFMELACLIIDSDDFDLKMTKISLSEEMNVPLALDIGRSENEIIDSLSNLLSDTEKRIVLFEVLGLSYSCKKDIHSVIEKLIDCFKLSESVVKRYDSLLYEYKRIVNGISETLLNEIL